jgi:hypothetical protein
MKILVIDLSIKVPSEGHEIINVSHDQGLVTFLTEQPDIVFCYAEHFGQDRSREDKRELVLCDIRNSLSSTQKLVRMGFTTGGPDQLLRLPFSLEEFRDCLRM